MPAGAPTRPLWTFALLLCNVLTLVLTGLEVTAFALLVAAFTLTIHTAQSDTSMILAMQILNTLRLCFIIASPGGGV
jgi:hypothetical protein